MRFYLGLDYEIFFGRTHGSVQMCLTSPTDALMAIADKHGVRLSLFVDVGYLRRLRHEARSHAELGVEHDAICRQLERAVSGGHEIQLHVHPHWEDASYDGSRWLMPLERYRLQDFSDDDIASIVRADSNAIANIAGVRPRAYRAGGWCVQPFDRLAKPLQSIGVEIDSTVYPGGRSVSPGREYDFRAAPTDSYWRFETDPLVPTENGLFIELPITPLTTYPLFYWRLVARAVSRRDRTLGDGVAVSKGARYYLSRLFSPTRCCASIDGEKARLIRQAFRGAQSTGGQVLNLMGHPKSQSKRSLELLDRFLAEHREHLEPSRFQDFELEDAARTDGVAHADGVQA